MELIVGLRHFQPQILQPVLADDQALVVDEAVIGAHELEHHIIRQEEGRLFRVGMDQKIVIRGILSQIGSHVDDDLIGHGTGQTRGVIGAHILEHVGIVPRSNDDAVLLGCGEKVHLIGLHMNAGTGFQILHVLKLVVVGDVQRLQGAHQVRGGGQHGQLRTVGQRKGSLIGVVQFCLLAAGHIGPVLHRGFRSLSGFLGACLSRRFLSCLRFAVRSLCSLSRLGLILGSSTLLRRG